MLVSISLASLLLASGLRFSQVSTITFKQATVDSQPQATTNFTYYGADLAKMKVATGVDATNPTATPVNGPWPQNAHNYCFLAGVQALVNYADLTSGQTIAYPVQNSQGPASGNPADEVQGQILYAMDHDADMQLTSGTLDMRTNPETGLPSPFTRANSSHDYGGDPRAQAVAAYNLSPSGYYYHQHIYHNGVDAAAHSLAIAVTAPHGGPGTSQPALAFVDKAYHVVVVAGVYADSDPSTNPNAIIQSFVVYNPWNQSWLNYLGGNYFNVIPYDDWVGNNPQLRYSWWKFPYKPNEVSDPDPYTGVYQAGTDPYKGNTDNPTLHHWIDQYVTIEADSSNYGPADNAIDENGNIMHAP